MSESTLDSKTTESKEVTTDEAHLTDHVYDGIQEYDNPLPGWWVWLFVGSVFFSFFYLVYFHMGAEGRSIEDEYTRHAANIFELRFEEIGDLEPDRATIVKYMTDDKWLMVGQAVYTTHCAGCHGPDGKGNIGPNLTDDHYKNVRKIEDIATVIQDGAANGAMPAWGNRLSHINQIVLTSAYVASMREPGSSGGKAPEGEVIPPWPTE